jgi:membrane-associated protein
VVVPIALLPEWLSAEGLFELLGPWALIGFTVIIFMECGLFIGMFFPGDSLLFLTGMLLATGAIDEPLWLALVMLYTAAVAGNIVGYHIGEAIGPRLFKNPESKILRPEYIEKTRHFFDKHGTKAIVLARFVPIVRTLITAVAGAAKMPQRTFYLYSALGAIIWVIGVTCLGYLLGEIPFVEQNLEVILLSFVLLSTIPVVWEVIKHRKQSKA